MIEFPDYDAFTLDDPRRLLTEEADFGVHWMADGQRWPCWRLTFGRDTREVYACQTGGGRNHGRVRLLALIDPDPVPERDRRFKRWHDVIERAMPDWAEEGHRDLSWALERLLAAGAEPVGMPA